METPAVVSTTTQAVGIAQSDILIRCAMIEAIADLRRNPWLMDYVFASLAQDELTKKSYGLREIEQAKKWFRKTNIPVVMNTRVSDPVCPAISIALMESVESEQTHGDINYVPTEDTEAEWPILAGPFAPTKWTPATGTMVLPVATSQELVVAPGMVILDDTGTPHEILTVFDDESEPPAIPVISVTLTPGTVASFRKAYIKGTKPLLVTTIESVSFRETYSIGCHVQGEVTHLTYLHSIVIFCLLRYKQDLLEARGFERSTLSSSQASRDDRTENEVSFNRFLSITGYVRQSWPKRNGKRVESMTTTVTASVNTDDIDLDVDALGADIS